MNKTSAIIRYLGESNYHPIWQWMKLFTDNRQTDTNDEIWFVEHRPVFTQGLAGRAEHLLDPGDIPVIQTDRGGQVTYHGPGQMVVYFLIDMRRKQIGIRDLVGALEQAIIDYLSGYEIKAHGRREAPGVYVDEKKICSIGLRIRGGCSYHGIAFNVNMDLQPFSRINPCGLRGLQMTQLLEFNVAKSVRVVSDECLPYILKNLKIWQK